MGGRRNWEGGCGGPWKAVTSVVGLRRRPLDDGAEVVGICLLPWRSMHISDRGGGCHRRQRQRIVGEKVAGVQTSIVVVVSVRREEDGKGKGDEEAEEGAAW